MIDNSKYTTEMDDYGQPTQPKDVSEQQHRRKARTNNKKKKNQEASDIFAFFKDQRLHITVGIVLFLAAIISVVMCITFISANEVDQSVTLGRSAAEIVAAGDPVENAGNSIGAKVAHVLMVDTFGIASLILTVYFSLLGLACVKVIRIRFWSLSFRCFFSAASVSIIIGFLTMNQVATFPLGGTHGQYINQILIAYAGALGCYAVNVLLVCLLIVVYLNPIKVFLRLLKRILPQRRKNVPEEEHITEEQLSSLDVLGQDNEWEQATEDNIITTEIAPSDEIEEGFSIDNPNSFMGDDSDVAVTKPIDGDAVTKPINGDVVTLPVVDGEPEMIINTPQEAPEAANIKDGDHIEIDSEYDPRAAHSAFVFPPPTDLLLERDTGVEVNAEEQTSNKQMIVNALRSYGIEIVRIEVTIGPTVTLYEIVPDAGIRIAKIKSLEDDIAMSLSALGIRIIAPIPGKGTIGIEVPNRKKKIVPMRPMIESLAFQQAKSRMKLPVAMGSTISNSYYIEDLAKMPHLLVAGATGQGKSVGLNCIITSLLYSKHPDELKFVLVDPKRVEFSLYNNIANAYMAKLPDEDSPIITDPMKALATLNSLCIEMDARFDLLADAGVRDMESYNERFIQRRLNPDKGHRYMPYLVMIVDEFADLISIAGKEIFAPIGRIAQKGRAAGMHMIIATQRPSTDVITGMIKANFPARIAFRVLSSIDSKTILDRPGAHRLIGRGDMLTFINGAVERVQCAFIDTDEIEAICDHIASQPGFIAPYELPEVPEETSAGPTSGKADLTDEMFMRCAMFIASQPTASITTLQRNFSIGFNKAGRYMDHMEALGIVGPANGAKPRQVLMTSIEVQRIFAEA